MAKTLIVGIGSILRGDDAVGTRVIDELEKENLPGDVKLHSGDISGLDLLKVFPGNDRVIIIDAADMGEVPGTVKVFESKDIKKASFNDHFSTHGMALLETLTLAERLEMDCRITIVGVQPFDTEFNLEMSEGMLKRVPEVIEEVKKLLS